MDKVMWMQQHMGTHLGYIYKQLTCRVVCHSGHIIHMTHVIHVQEASSVSLHCNNTGKNKNSSA
jgi:hypothetical protein